MFDMGAPEFGYPRAMPFMFTGAPEDQALCMIITTGYGGFDAGYVLMVESSSVYR